MVGTGETHHCDACLYLKPRHDLWSRDHPSRGIGHLCIMYTHIHPYINYT